MYFTPIENQEHHDGYGLNDMIRIEADEPGVGGASHEYQCAMTVPHTLDGMTGNIQIHPLRLEFQHGPPGGEGSTYGVTHEALYAILLDRLRAFQAGPFPSEETDAQIRLIEEALSIAVLRVKRRAARGVLGKNIK